MTKPVFVLLDVESAGNDIPLPDFASLGQVTVYDFTTPDKVVERAKDAEFLFINKIKITRQVIEQLPKLKYIGTLSTGFNQVDLAAAKERNITVCNVPDYSTPSVMQHTFALILSLANEIGLHVKAVNDGEWSNSKHFCFWKKPTMELAGKTLGVVGFGNTGSAVARMGHAFGMNVVVHVPRPKPKPEYEPFAFVTLEELFATSDVVTLHCPLTADNKEMVNAKLLATMKKSALFINCARGDLVNDNDLADALHKGLIAGAGLDVVQHEPMKNDNPLRTAPNCIITPHIAWCSVEARTRLMTGVFMNVKNYLAGTPTNVVSK